MHNSATTTSSDTTVPRGEPHDDLAESLSTTIRGVYRLQQRNLLLGASLVTLLEDLQQLTTTTQQHLCEGSLELSE